MSLLKTLFALSRLNLSERRYSLQTICSLVFSGQSHHKTPD